MRSNRRAQSFIEYTMIAVLVIFGVITMGPYLLRSINAHFKIWDDQIQDAHNERLVSTPIPPPPPMTCQELIIAHGGSGCQAGGGICPNPTTEIADYGTTDCVGEPCCYNRP